MERQPSARTIFIGLIVVSLVLLALVARPFIQPLFLAAVLGGALFPAQKWLTNKLWGRRTLAAGVLCLLVIAALLLPLGGFTALVAREVVEVARFVTETLQQKGIEGLIEHLPASLSKALRYVLDRVPMEGRELLGALQDRLTEQGAEAAGLATAAVTRTGALLLDATMMLIALFFLLIDGPRLVAWFEDVSPLRSGQTTELLREFRNVSVSVLTSSVSTALVQTVIALVGYLITGVPRPWLFTLATFFLAFIPTIGAGGACLAAALVLYVTGAPWMALVIALWGTVLVGLSDNLVKPLLARRGMHMHGAVVFFALLSGLAAFGAIGLLLGPLIVSFLLALIRMYRRDFAPER